MNKPMNKHMNKRAVFFILALAAALLLPFGQHSLRAFNIGALSFYITDDVLYQYNRQSGAVPVEGTKHQYYETITLFGNYKQWSAGLTLRINNFYKQTPNVTLPKLGVNIYRQYIQYNSRNLDVTVGDFYAMLGRGMVLSVLKNEDILRERTVLGGDLRYNKGKLDIRLLGGLVKDDDGWQEWLVGGGEIVAEYAKNHRIGVHASLVDDRGTNLNLDKRLTYSVSLKGTKLLKNFSYYTEAAFLRPDDPRMENGYGIFSNLAYSRSHVTFFLEFKRYKDFNNRMNTPPTADREDEVSSVNDTTGLRFHFQYAFFDPDITLFFNIGRYKEYTDTGNHIYGGFIVEDVKDRLSMSLTYGVRDIRYRIKRWDGHLLYRLGDRWSGEFVYKDKRYKDGFFTFTETDHTFQVSYSPRISVFVMHQYSHNRIMDLNHFYSGGIRYWFRGGSAVELSGGTMRGGQVCSGGQCYVMPPFKGVKFTFHYVFK